MVSLVRVFLFLHLWGALSCTLCLPGVWKDVADLIQLKSDALMSKRLGAKGRVRGRSSLSGLQGSGHPTAQKILPNISPEDKKIWWLRPPKRHDPPTRQCHGNKKAYQLLHFYIVHVTILNNSAQCIVHQ